MRTALDAERFRNTTAYRIEGRAKDESALATIRRGYALRIGTTHLRERVGWKWRTPMAKSGQRRGSRSLKPGGRSLTLGRPKTAAPVTVIHRDGSTEVRDADSFNRRSGRSR